MQNETGGPQSLLQPAVKLASMALVVAIAGVGARLVGIAPTGLAQISICTFVGVICTTLFFWPHRVSVSFLGVAILIGTKTMTLRGM